MLKNEAEKDLLEKTAFCHAMFQFPHASVWSVHSRTMTDTAAGMAIQDKNLNDPSCQANCTSSSS